MTITRRVAAALDSSRALFLIAVLAGSLGCVGFLGLGDTDHIVTAKFRNAEGLVVGNEVRIAGVEAGTVKSVQFKNDPVSGAAYVLVDMNISAGSWPLRQGTTLAVRPKGVLSNVFVNVNPGATKNPPLGDHPQFELNQTQSPVNLDAFTNLFTPNVRDAIRTQLQEGVLAFGGTGAQDLNQTLANANPLTLDLISVTDVLATRSPQLDNLNYEFDTITAELAREDSNLRPLIANLDTTLGALAAKESDLQGTLTHAANVFGDLADALSSPATQADLARIFQVGPQALNCATAIADYITPVITAVNPYIKYKQPFALDDLLNSLVTATGYNGDQPGLLYSKGDALRAFLIATPSASSLGYTWQDTGGLTVEHPGYTNAKINGHPVYAEQPPLTGASHYPTLSGCTPPAGLP
jgi:phospholipid/cholesterol/gamma-HCH transport system substrate-binding protein